MFYLTILPREKTTKFRKGAHSHRGLAERPGCLDAWVPLRDMAELKDLGQKSLKKTQENNNKQKMKEATTPTTTSCDLWPFPLELHQTQ